MGCGCLPSNMTKSEWNCNVVKAVVSRQAPVVGIVVGRSSLAVGQPDDGNLNKGNLTGNRAAERRENVAHGASRGFRSGERY